MRVCFIHQNMPAQFRHLIGALLQRGDEVLAVGERGAVERWGMRHPRLSVFGYGLPKPEQFAATPPHLRELDGQIARGRAVARALQTFNAKGLKPDLIVVHPGWGEAMFIRAECPDTPMLGYCEFFYRARGADVGFDPEYPSSADGLARLQLRKTPHLLALDDIDAGVCPTEWQRAQFPADWQHKLSVVHEGVDTRLVKPDAQAEFEWGGLKLRRGDPVVTYVARNLEPYRGFHVFMRCLPALQSRAPEARVVMVGGDDVSYGQRLPEGQSYRARLQAELGDRVDWSRVHFTGKLPYAQYLKLLQVSAVHAYLTYPFVLSWSMLEAMASGCAVVGSDTAPVREVVEHGRNGWLTDFFDTDALAQQVAQVLRGGAEVQAAREAARATVVQRYDLLTRCLPDGLKLLERVAARGRTGQAA